MDGKSQKQTSFEEELNRLNFLASIASCSKSSDEPKNGKTKQIVVSAPHCAMRNVNNVAKGNYSLFAKFIFSYRNMKLTRN